MPEYLPIHMTEVIRLIANDAKVKFTVATAMVHEVKDGDAPYYRCQDGDRIYYNRYVILGAGCGKWTYVRYPIHEMR